MKYIAAVLVIIAFYWIFSGMKSEDAEVPYVAPPPGEMSEVEKDYYVKVFDYAMAVLAKDQSYSWQSSNVNAGSISVSELFKSKSNSTCRNFAERFNLAGVEINHTGIACKREGADGWCRLKEGDALTCALEKPGVIVIQQVPGASGNFTLPNAGGGIGKIGIPSGSTNVNAPQMPGMPERNNRGSGNSPSGQGYADTVTGTAGSAAGPASKTMKDWFTDTFR